MQSSNAHLRDDSVLYRSYAVPFIIFMLLTLLFPAADAFFTWDHPEAAWWQRAPEMLVYPLQTIICGGYLWWTRRGVEWDWAWKPCLLGALLGAVGIGLWLVPYFTGWAETGEGFDPGRIFGEGSAMFYIQYLLRFLRAVVIVALVEEFFWRGFLMRWVIDRDNPQSVPFGTASWKAYFVTTVGFILIHQPQDYAGAFIFGTLAYFLTVKTKCLTSLVVYHAMANLIMGLCAVTLDMSGLW